ncbi:MAG: 4-(cytidine 5'-diphospho)-2-C-methyl-D-erythritol kinase [Chloroflexi bacterium]|nr:4-(cytidine 5'-diphospho)-2-C-methyl-D-erythritol kinase [Chloroflexota bacterium]HEV8054243.1 4-(cytidine 5'-diphospho)-2-C-methyl-D-erythritol kinase [Candidatus Limnocylindrales bacterium]
MRERAPGKLNLTLSVLGRRPDGFHDLDSIFARLELADELDIRLSTVGREAQSDAPLSDRLVVQGDPDCPVDGNLVLAATRLLRRHAGRALPGLDLRLRKRVPLGAGLGGGSSDGAATLRAARAAWSLTMTDRDLAALGAELGSDVPFFLEPAPLARVRGRGEHVAALCAPGGEVGVLMAIAHGPLSTREVYAAHDALGRSTATQSGTARLVERLEAGMDAATLSSGAEQLRDANDLWAAAVRLRPALAPLRDRLEAVLGRPFLLSGSGPTLFALYPSRRSAMKDSKALAERQDPALRESRLIATAIERSSP